MNPFKKATKHEAKLRLALVGPAGSGKTFSALKIATAMGGKIGLVDTEHGSALKYADIFAFDHVDFEPPFHPDRYVNLINIAVEAGYDTLIIDGLSHAWKGPGGLLEQVDQIAARSSSKNSFQAWGEGTRIQNELIDAILASKIHVIATMRSKTEYVVEENEKGRKTPRKVGTAPIQRDGVEFEFDIVGELDQENTMTVTKSRCVALSKQVIREPGAGVAKALTAWLAGEPAPERAKKEPEPAKPRANSKPASERPANSKPASDKQRLLMAELAGNVLLPEDWRAQVQLRLDDSNLTLADASKAIEMCKAKLKDLGKETDAKREAEVQDPALDEPPDWMGGDPPAEEVAV